MAGLLESALPQWTSEFAMPPDQHVNTAEEPSPSRPEGPAADGATFTPGVLCAPASRIRIQPQVTRTGRGPGNDIVVADLGVSKQHAELRRAPAGRCSITDLGSHVSPHTLRHAFITAALDAGVPLHDVQEAASHADPHADPCCEAISRLRPSSLDAGRSVPATMNA